MIKKANVDVYVIKHSGAGFVNPPWTKKTFPGPIETDMQLLISQKDLSQLSLEHLYERICQGLAFKPSEFIQKKNYSYRIKDIKGLENVIYACPVCGHEGLVAHQKTLTCLKCQHELTMDQKGLLNGQGIDAWFDQQEQNVRRMVDQNEEYCIEGKARLMSFRKHKLIEVGCGSIKLSNHQYSYDGTVDHIEQHLTFEVKNTPTLPSDIGRNIQIYEGYQIFQFEFEIPWLATKFVHVGEYLYEKSKNRTFSHII